VDGFSKRYGVHSLVWYELHDTMESAIRREKSIKAWKRRWKLGFPQTEACIPACAGLAPE
jgi:putative endonuclease